MIGLDTNVLIRILVADTGEMTQVEQARKVVSQHEEVLISQTVQIETIWVLKRAYALSKAELIRVLEHLQNNRGFVLENFKVFNDALTLYRNSNVGFSDSVILAFSKREHCDLLTFDKKLLKLDGAKRVK